VWNTSVHFADQNYWDDAFYSSIVGQVMRPNLIGACMSDMLKSQHGVRMRAGDGLNPGLL
jgi:hypothetical protein